MAEKSKFVLHHHLIGREKSHLCFSMQVCLHGVALENIVFVLYDMLHFQASHFGIFHSKNVIKKMCFNFFIKHNHFCLALFFMY
jgi:hypothetical protein